MILIADSGSTKTEWRIIEGTNRMIRVLTDGINPHYQSDDEIKSYLQKAIIENKLPKSVHKIFFYGAGCSSVEKEQKIREILERVFDPDSIFVASDMLGVARAVCGKRQGIVSILGTGSGSCIYDGLKIVKQVPSLGYILGDEGSGAHLGKKLLADYLRNALSGPINRKFEKEFTLDKEQILFRLQHDEYPSRFLAGFSKFIHKNLYDARIQQLVKRAFSDFIEQYIIPYGVNKHVPVRFCGSVAFYFADILRIALKDYGLVAGQIVESPGDGLTQYHLEELKV